MRILTALWTSRSTDPLAQMLPDWVNAALIGGTLAAVSWLERRRPLRRW